MLHFRRCCSFCPLLGRDKREKNSVGGLGDWVQSTCKVCLRKLYGLEACNGAMRAASVEHLFKGRQQLIISHITPVHSQVTPQFGEAWPQTPGSKRLLPVNAVSCVRVCCSSLGSVTDSEVDVSDVGKKRNWKLMIRYTRA